MTTEHHLPPAPVAPRRPHTITTHGDARVDPWHWLREQEDPATLEYLHAENAYTEAFLSPLQPLQSAIYDEIRGRIKEDDNTVPEKEDEYYYYVRYEEGGQYPIHCRKRGSEDGPEEILLDVNKLAEGRDYTSLGSFANSPDHRLFAYGADFDGSEQFTIRCWIWKPAKLYPTPSPTPTTACNGLTIAARSTTRCWTSITAR